MGKVKDEAPAKTSKPATKPGGSKGVPSRVAPFFTNLLRTDVVKPNQGKQARLWTAIGLGVLVLAGLYQLYVYYLADLTPAVRYSIPTAIGLVFGWLIFRIVQYPPFVDFLIATEAEMNKVSWTTRDDLYRATVVVLATVLIMAVFLFGVDLVWSRLLQALGVLRFDGGGAFGSQEF